MRVVEIYFCIWSVLLLSIGGQSGLLLAQDGVVDLPRPVTEADFEQMKNRSPFLRTLNLTDTYVLRAVVSLGEESLATLYNQDTKKTVVISSNGSDESGMKLMEISPADELGKVSVKVSVGGEVVELKYDEKSVAPVGKGIAAKGGKEKGGKDGRKKRKGPRPEEVKRYKALPPEKREKFHQYVRQTMKKYPDISREEKGNMIRGALIRLSDGQNIEVEAPKPSPEAKR